MISSWLGKRLRLVARCFLWAAGLVIVISALLLLAGRLAVTTINGNQALMQGWLQDKGLATLEFDSLQVDFHTLAPGLAVQKLRIEADGDYPLVVDSLAIRFSTLQSLLHGSPVITELDIAGLRSALDIQQGRVSLQGFAAADASWNLDLLDSIEHLRKVKLTGIQVDVNNEGSPVRVTTADEESWVTLAEQADSGLSRVLSLALQVESGQAGANQAEVRLAGGYGGDPRDEDFLADLYLGVRNLDLQPFSTSRPANADWRLANAELNLSLWLSKIPGKVSIHSLADLARVQLLTERGRVSLLTDASARARFEGSRFDRGSLAITDFSLHRDDISLALGDMQLAVQCASQQCLGGDHAPALAASDLHWVMGLGAVDLELLFDFVRDLDKAGLVSQAGMEALQSLNPRGELTNLVLAGNLDPASFRLVSQIRRLQTGAWSGVPAMNQVNGLVALSQQHGYIDLDNQVPLSFEFAGLFPEPWPFTAASGRISYAVLPDKLLVHSGLIALQDGDLNAWGKLVFNLPPEPSQRTWALIIGIRNADLNKSHKFLPSNLDVNLTDWIKAAIVNGQAQEAGLLFHGALGSNVPYTKRVHGLWFRLADARVNFHEDWPNIENLATTLHVANHEVTSLGATGQLLGASAKQLDVIIPDLEAPDGASQVLVTGKVEGDLSAAIRLLNETPLAEMTGQMASTWSAEGQLAAAIDLKIPLQPDEGQATEVEVVTQFSDSLLNLANFRLAAHELEGNLSWSNRGGLSSTGFSGLLFGYPVQGSITTKKIESNDKGHGDDRGEIWLSLDGTIDIEDLHDWSGQLLLSKAEGVADYSGVLNIPYGGSQNHPEMEITSTLEGVTLDLPVPLGKPEPDTIMDLIWHQTFLAEGYDLAVSAGDTVHASLRVDDDTRCGGRVHFGHARPSLVTYDSIRVTGALPSMDMQAWVDTALNLTSQADVPLQQGVNQCLHSVDLQLGQLSFYGFDLQNVKAYVTHQPGQWQLRLDSDQLAGSLVLPEMFGEQPVRVSLEHLHLPEGTDSDRDPLANLDPASLVNMDLAVNQLWLGSEDFGSWSFKYRQLPAETESSGKLPLVREVTGKGVIGRETSGDEAMGREASSKDASGQAGKISRGRFSDLHVELAGMTIQPTTHLTWSQTDKGHSSQISSNIDIDDLALTLQQFGIAPSVEGEGIRLDAELHWAGSPAMFDTARLNGMVNLHEGSGKFVQADVASALKLLGIFDFVQLGRRFRFDFSDLVRDGYEFRDISGSMRLHEGTLEATDPLVIEASSGQFTLAGSVDLVSGAVDSDLIVTLPLSRTLPWYAAYSAIAISPLSGAGVMFAKQLFEDQINTITSAKYTISGTLTDPQIDFVSIFDASVREVSDIEEEPAEESARP